MNHDQDNAKLEMTGQDLIVFIPDNVNSIDDFKTLIRQRNRENRGFWLLDVSATFSTSQANELLQNLRLDFDDDIFWYRYVTRNLLRDRIIRVEASADELTVLSRVSQFQTNNAIDVWEAYKIHDETDLIVKHIGEWSMTRGEWYRINHQAKWQRRGNLEGIPLKTLELKSSPYVTDNEPDGKIAFKTITSEIFSTMEVNFKSTPLFSLQIDCFIL